MVVHRKERELAYQHMRTVGSWKFGAQEGGEVTLKTVDVSVYNQKEVKRSGRGHVAISNGRILYTVQKGRLLKSIRRYRTKTGGMITKGEGQTD